METSLPLKILKNVLAKSLMDAQRIKYIPKKYADFILYKPIHQSHIHKVEKLPAFHLYY